MQCYNDIPVEYKQYEESSPNKQEDKILRPLNTLNQYFITEKEKRIVMKMYEKGIANDYLIVKKTGIKHNGTSIIIKFKNDGSEILKMSEDEIFSSLRQDEKINDLSVFVSVHDFDWQAICYFEHDELYKKFIEYLLSRAEIEYVKDWDKLPG